jgi:hypothetical protein
MGTGGALDGATAGEAVRTSISPAARAMVPGAGGGGAGSVAAAAPAPLFAAVEIAPPGEASGVEVEELQSSATEDELRAESTTTQQV